MSKHTRILVTGATGFIGRHLCRRLVAEGHRVLALVRSPDKARVLPDDVEILRGDLGLFRDPSLTLPPCDVVVHLAGAIFAPDEAGYHAVNCTSVGDLVDCIERQSWTPKRFVFTSSLAAAGPSAGPDAVRTEADEDAPIEPYGRSKKAAEQLLVDRASFPTTTLRPAMVIGAEDDNMLTLFRMAQKGVGFRVRGAGEAISYVDVADVVESIMVALDDDRPGHQCYFVAHPEPMDTASLWGALGEAVGRRVRVAVVPRSVLWMAAMVSTAVTRVLGRRNQLDAKQYKQMVARAYVCSSEALQRDRHWQPQYDLHASVTRAHRGYQAAGMLR